MTKAFYSPILRVGQYDIYSWNTKHNDNFVCIRETLQRCGIPFHGYSNFDAGRRWLVDQNMEYAVVELRLRPKGEFAFFHRTLLEVKDIPSVDLRGRTRKFFTPLTVMMAFEDFMDQCFDHEQDWNSAQRFDIYIHFGESPESFDHIPRPTPKQCQDPSQSQTK